MRVLLLEVAPFDPAIVDHNDGGVIAVAELLQQTLNKQTIELLYGFGGRQ